MASYQLMGDNRDCIAHVLRVHGWMTLVCDYCFGIDYWIVDTGERELAESSSNV